MKVILRKEHEKLGNIGDVVDVKDGYARNYLFPRNIAFPATKGAVAVLEEEKKRTQEILDEGIRLLKEQGFNTTGHLTVGEPVEEICRVATDLGADLIVLGHRQKLSFAARWWKGSVGASLLDYAPCSILIARAKSE